MLLLRSESSTFKLASSFPPTVSLPDYVPGPFELYAIGVQPQAGPRYEYRRRDVVRFNDRDCHEQRVISAQMLLHSHFSP